MVGPDKLDRDVKLGRGGIRDIEFVVQTLQLIHGARAAMTPLSGTQTALGKWLRGLRARAHVNIVVVISLHQRIRSQGRALAEMEIRAPWSS